MKQNEFKKCALCKRGVMHSGMPIFFRVTVERMGIDLAAVQRQHGLEMMIGPLAAAMGTDDDLAKSIDSERNIIICEECAQENGYYLLRLMEAASKSEGKS